MTSMYKYSILLIMIIWGHFTLKSEITEDYINELKNNEVVIRLFNGDIFTCIVKDLEYESGTLNAISIQTQIGKTKVFLKEIAEILPSSQNNRNSHRIYLLPTAEPIGKNHFIGNFELLMLYGEIGRAHV